MPSRKIKPLRVADLFCGAGGFSEGFSQMGFDVVYALDNWRPAVEAHRLNHPECETVLGDVLAIEPSDLPEIDVLIGGPPCTEFSYAKKGGKGDISLGMKLVERFLEYVVDLKPKYWIMENVPRLLNTLPDKISFERLSGERKEVLEIPHRKVHNSADYGAPQIRTRLLSGNYPVPIQTHTEEPIQRLDLPPTDPWVTMGDILERLPDPLMKGPYEGALMDPNYPSVTIPLDHLTDHFYNTLMPDEMAKANRKAKVDHSWYGRMSFPDPIDRPSRTIMATQLGASRETIALEVRRGERKRYRQPTIRECACLQGYPITYQFPGNTFGTRYKLVGNSVPGHLSRALAGAILMAEGRVPPETPIVRLNTEPVKPLGKVMYSKRQRLRRLSRDRKFRDHVPGSKGRGYRVDLDNLGEQPRKHPLGGKHEVEWVTRLYIGSGKDYAAIVPTRAQIYVLVEQAMKDWNVKTAVRAVKRDTERTFKGKVPDATTMQGIHAEWTTVRGWSPVQVLERVGRIVSKHSKGGLRDHRVTSASIIPETNTKGMPLDIVMVLVALDRACEFMNEGQDWLESHTEDAFRFDDPQG